MLVPDGVSSVHPEAAGLAAMAERLIASLPCRESVQVEGLAISLRALEPAQSGWVMKYLEPLSLDRSDEVSRRVDCASAYSDEFVLTAVRYLHTPGIETFDRSGRGDAPLRCAALSPDRTLYCDPAEGIVWVVDLEAGTILQVHSSRTRFPPLVFARTVRGALLGWLESRGWVSFHAGAVVTESGVWMIVGEAGAGKTSLILGLMREGARFVANERLLVSLDGDRPRALGYPMAIAVGIGSASQFPRLAELIDAPDPLLYPRNRYDTQRVARTPRERRYRLHDKLQLLPEEIASRVGAAETVPGGFVDAIVVPSVSRHPVALRASTLDRDALRTVLEDNCMGVAEPGRQPTWLSPSGEASAHVDAEPLLVEGLLPVVATRCRYSLDHETPGRPLTECIADALDSQVGDIRSGESRGMT